MKEKKEEKNLKYIDEDLNFNRESQEEYEKFDAIGCVFGTLFIIIGAIGLGCLLYLIDILFNNI